MRVRILGGDSTGAFNQAKQIIGERGHELVSTLDCDLAIAPLLTTIMPYSELCRPLLGTLIFHPSPLPYGRGAVSIKKAYKRNEPITAATWFWANNGKVDSGNICEMEIVKIDYNLRPRVFYETHILPAMGRTLNRCLNGLEKGIKREVPQVEEYSSFDKAS